MISLLTLVDKKKNHTLGRKKRKETKGLTVQHPSRNQGTSDRGKVIINSARED